jgi:hypothetical protein
MEYKEGSVGNTMETLCINLDCSDITCTDCILAYRNRDEEFAETIEYYLNEILNEINIINKDGVRWRVSKS